MSASAAAAYEREKNAVIATITRENLEEYTILRAVTGSQAYGLATPTSDFDRKAIVIEPIADVCGIGAPWEGKVYSQAGTDDFEVYGLRKFLRLALKGNPTVTELLFVKPESADARGNRLQELAPLIVSRQAGKAYLGYLHAQRMHLTGERKNGGHGQPRLDLIAQFGFDTKFAMHMLRLGVQGVELLSTGRLTLPIEGPELGFLRAVREGAVPLADCFRRAEELEDQLRGLLTTSAVQAEPQTQEVEKWMLQMYFMNWSANRSHGGLGGVTGDAPPATAPTASGWVPRSGVGPSVVIGVKLPGVEDTK